MMLQLPLNVQLDDQATLDNFFVGTHLQLLQKLSLLPTFEGEFLLVWGAKNTGKTHLAQALCHWFEAHGLTSAYLPLNNAAISPAILEGLETYRLICIDNFERFEQSALWEPAVFNLYNQIKDNGGNLIIFCQHSLQQLTFRLADLQSRIAAMEAHHLTGLSSEQQLAFLIWRGSKKGIEINADVGRFILQRSDRSVSAIVKLLEILDHGSIALQRKITIPFVKQVLGL